MVNTESVPRSILSEPYAVDLIRYLYRKQELMATQLRDVHSNYLKMTSLVNSLSNNGIISICRETKPRVTFTYRLTEKGKIIAEKLNEIEDLIENS